MRPFKIAVEWTWLLFEEFFDQGDTEKQQDLPISFLCDRTTTQISSSQPGFLNFIVVPLFVTIADIMPQLKQLEINAKANAENWMKYTETEEDKKIYLPRKDSMSNGKSHEERKEEAKI